MTVQEPSPSLKTALTFKADLQNGLAGIGDDRAAYGGVVRPIS
jgi:hypothetical protein